MPLYKNWDDFDALRDKNKVLVIYGAGANGHRFLNNYEIVPDYFCDKDATRIKNVVGGRGEIIPCLTLKQLLAKLKEKDADILISNMDGEIIKSLHKGFNKTKFTENTVIYFHHNYNIINENFTNRINFYKMNNKVTDIFSINVHRDYIVSNFDIGVILKNAYFSDHFSSNKEYENFMKSRYFIRKFTNGRVRAYVESNFDMPNESKKLNGDKIIYFFGDSRFVNAYCKYEYRMKSILMSLLNKNNSISYKIENYSDGGFVNEQNMFQLTNTHLIENSIVIINRIEDPYLLAVAKLYCLKYNCRLIYYFMPYIFSRNTITDYEKWYIEQFTKEYKENVIISDKKLQKKIKLVTKMLNIEFYEPPSDFFNSDKIIFLDMFHFGDYGIEIIANHLHEIITSQPVYHNNDLCEDFHIEPAEKIEYANSVMPRLIPDIPVYLNDLKKYRQNLENCGAIVMNCNPFTLGHKYLIEYATSRVEHLYLFVVEEDKSEFSFKDRYKLVIQNIKDLKNVTVLPSGKFIISSQTFDDYFGKSGVSEEQAVEQDVSFDLLIFAAAIAPTLNIKTRFVGQEPFDPLTRHYNEEMKKLLPEYGCDVVEIPRLEKDGGAVSASRVRKFLKDGNFEEIRKIVPAATFRYLRKFSTLP